MTSRASAKWLFRAQVAAGILSVAGIAACDTGPTVSADPSVVLEVTVAGLPALDTLLSGPYELWAIGTGGEVASMGRFAGAADASPLTVGGTAPLAEPAAVMVTLEPVPDSTPAGPSELRLVGGRFDGQAAVLGTLGYLTPNLPLEIAPGAHVLGTFADPATGAGPGAGLWLHNPGSLADTLDGSYFVDLTPLTAGWLYEGWVVMDYGTPTAVWFSYGKFAPDDQRQVSGRDETGLGPFSGVLDYERTLPFDAIVPGDDWAANPLGVAVPGDLPLPLDLNGCLGSACPPEWAGPSRFTHVITIEPYNDRWEDPWVAEPFFLEVYRNAIGEADEEQGRTLILRTDRLPTGTARIVP